MKSKVELGSRGLSPPHRRSTLLMQFPARFGFGRTHIYLPGMSMGIPETLGESCSAFFLPFRGSEDTPLNIQVGTTVSLGFLFLVSFREEKGSKGSQKELGPAGCPGSRQALFGILCLRTVRVFVICVNCLPALVRACACACAPFLFLFCSKIRPPPLLLPDRQRLPSAPAARR